MKKSLLALAVLGAAAFSAHAATVTLYGAVDGGFRYDYSKTKALDTHSSSFKLADGLAGSNKFGLKGSEELGNVLTVGFKLENGFHIANGAMKGESGVLFDREARLFVKGAFGEVAAGRVGSLGSSLGSYDMFFGNGDAFDGGDKLGTGFVTTGMLNNSVTYVSPEIAGAQVYAQYSFSQVKGQADKFNKNDRQWGLGATFAMDNFAVAGLVEQALPATDGLAVKPKKLTTFGLGANVTLDNLKLFGAVQYANHVTSVDGITDALKTDKFDAKFIDAKNFAGTLGAQYTMGANEFTVAGYLAHAKDRNAGIKTKADYMGLDGRYTYNLSKRTSVFVGADAARIKVADVVTLKTVEFTAYTGLHHNF